MKEGDDPLGDHPESDADEGSAVDDLMIEQGVNPPRACVR